MSDLPPAPRPPDEPAPSFSERLTVPWWWWPPVLVVTWLLAAGMHLGYPGLRSWLPYVLLIPLAIGGLIVLGRTRVGVQRGEDRAEVHAGPRRLDLDLVGAVDVVRGAQARQDALGPQLDPAAHVVQRPWIGALVRIEVLDPADRTPYWVVSTRQPDRLVAALTGRTGAASRRS